MKVLICDDEDQRGQQAATEIRGVGNAEIEVEELFGDRLTTALQALFQQAARFLDKGLNGNNVEATIFDNCDLVILDNNLAHLDFKGTRLTAEAIAGYIRAFTKAPYIVSLNKNSDVDFDLRYLVGDYATRADLALNTPHLSNPGLWTGRSSQAKDSFKPWYWPALTIVPERRRQQIEFLRNRLDQPVLAALSFPDEALDFLSRHAKGALSPDARWDASEGGEGIAFRALTFRNVFLTPAFPR